MPSQTDKHTRPALSNKKPLVVLLGPTAVGKSDLAINLAAFFNGEIISADSRLFYRGMDIGTAKPATVDQERIQHHLIDISDPDDVWTLARFQKAAVKVIQDIHSRNRLPFLVGGTGQYIRAVIEGWDIPKVNPRPNLRKALEKLADEIGRDELHNRLKILDPEAGVMIDPTNLRRTIRALEVIFSTGYRFSEQKRRTPSPYQTLIIGLTRPRSELYNRIDDRIETMLEEGLIDEVSSLLEAGYSPNLPAMSAIGYRQIIAFLKGKINLQEALREIKRKTRIFVRRQANWFKKNDPDINWFTMNDKTEGEVKCLITDWLASMNNDKSIKST